MATLPPPIEDAARSSADPAAVRLAAERIAEARPASLDRLDEPLARTFAAVVAASRSLSRLVVADADALAALEGPIDLAAVAGAADAPELARRKRLCFLRIAAADLTGDATLEQVGEALSRLADAVLAGAYRLAEPEVPLAVIGMGKHGAEELNYASDVDVVVVAPNGVELAVATTAARRVLALASQSYRIDTDLRPEGRNGALVRTLDAYEAYWARWARPWEFQALVKARPSAGDEELGRRFALSAAEALWSRRIDAEALAELRTMKARTEEIVVRRGLAGRELKRGPGGIRDVEFAVQLLQLVHGPSDTALRVRQTLGALSELAGAGYVDAGDATALALAYRFLRTVEHRLQLVEEAQVHTVPPPGPARDHLVRVLGFAGAPLGPVPEEDPPLATRRRTTSAGRSRTDRFDVVLARHQSAARSIHERLFFRPLLEVFAAGLPGGETGAAGGALRLSEAAAAERLAAFGFRRTDRTREALTELTRGLTRSSRLMHQLLPVLLDWLSETPDPDLGLLGLRNLAGMPHQRDVLVAAFRDSPELARRLCVVLGTSRSLGELAKRHPAAALAIGDDASLAPPARQALVEQAVMAADCDPSRAGRALRRVVGEHVLRIAAADLLSNKERRVEPPVSRQLAELGEATLAAALHVAAPGLPFGLVAMGRLGGSELAYGSDLDVLAVYDGHGAADTAEGERAAAALLRLLNGPTPSEGVWATDASLRPEGRRGPLARSLDAFAQYHARWISPWERQALVRARPLAGDAGVLDRFMRLAEATVWERPFGTDDLREIRRLKARTERERIPSGEDPQFHFKLGRGSLADIEWTVQLLQIEHGVRATSTGEALAALEQAGALAPGESAALGEALAFLERTRNRWHLVGNYVAGAGAAITRSGADSLPQSSERLALLARSLGELPSELRERYRRVTRRARRVVEQRFYGL
ncbi:MAG TPA: bifunctional [glutamine synthetase] adenylyltransferase/[glutamine synthetase]-adenylyl-L-tyrosine phosphorylase [Acidimicrobiales bacterium]|nr:bifunctional [glutamine synthetase] adenylyltransferase/[glutamine synthetase]-adenylyl-L-tyrosine phosphorylase [Acidimicrobiales bacterium]